MMLLLDYFIFVNLNKEWDRVWQKKFEDVCCVTWDIFISNSITKPIIFEHQSWICIWYLLRPRCSSSHTSLCCIFTIDNYFSITHLFDVMYCITLLLFFFFSVEEWRLAVVFFEVDFWLMCRLFRLNDLSNGSFKQLHLNLKSLAVFFSSIFLSDSWLIFTPCDLKSVSDRKDWFWFR